MLRSCLDLTACTRSTFGNGCIWTSFFSFILTSNKSYMFHLQLLGPKASDYQVTCRPGPPPPAVGARSQHQGSLVPDDAQSFKVSQWRCDYTGSNTMNWNLNMKPWLLLLSLISFSKWRHGRVKKMQFIIEYLLPTMISYREKAGKMVKRNGMKTTIVCVSVCLCMHVCTLHVYKLYDIIICICIYTYTHTYTFEMEQT